jgi:hypothetical protein
MMGMMTGHLLLQKVDHLYPGTIELCSFIHKVTINNYFDFADAVSIQTWISFHEVRKGT